MTNWPVAIVLAVMLPGAVVSWVLAVASHIAFATEVRRAMRSGELFSSRRGLPLFKKNVLPRVEKDRVLALRAMGAFVGFIIGGLIVEGAACRIWVCQ